MKRVGVIAAWEPEISALAKRFPALERHRAGGWVFNVHRDGEVEIVYVVCGVGKVYCASCTQLLIAKFSPHEVYMTGICGGLGNGVSAASLVIPEKTLQYDVQSPGDSHDPWDLYAGRSATYVPDPLLLQRFRDFLRSTEVSASFGVVVSGDRRIRQAERRDLLRKTFGAIAVDQEIAAFAHVCTLNQVPFLCLKAVSDNADEQTERDQQRHKLKAADVAANTLIDFLTIAT